MRSGVRRLLPLLALGGVLSARGDVPSGFTVDPAVREQARILYNTVYLASENVPSGWTGDVAHGIAGTTSIDFQDAVRLRVNYFRAMAGVPAAIAFSDAHNAADQQDALMMSANQAEDHHPPASWLYYTAAGADAARNSNLYFGVAGPAAITGYMQDPGTDNTAAGHRRELLSPPQTLMGTGDVDGSADGAYLPANALWTGDYPSYANPAPAPRDKFVAWPPPGYVPYNLIFPRWSFSYPNADFSAATVTMTRAGKTVPVQLEPLANFGDPALVWVPDGQDPAGQPTPVPPTVEAPVTVTVANFLVDGAAQSFTYTVTPFDPSIPGADTVTPTVAGPDQPTVGTANPYTFNAVPGATGYRWQVRAQTPLALDLDAENGPGDVTILPADTPLVTTAEAAHGQASYQFASLPPETMTLDAVFTPQAGGMLSFNSRLGVASPDETARAQISTDGGVSWTDLYTLAGDSAVGLPREMTFDAHTISLDPYAGKLCRVRFSYAYDFGPVGTYTRDDGVGWFVDDITLTGTQTVSDAPVTGDLTATQLAFDFTPTAAGVYALQVEPLFFGQYPANAGPVLTVTAGGADQADTTVTVSATNRVAHASTGESGVFTLTRAADGDLSQQLVVRYTLAGSAVNGADYAKLTGKAKIKPNKTSATITIAPQTGGTGKVKLVLTPGTGYSVDDPASALVKIKP